MMQKSERESVITVEKLGTPGKMLEIPRRPTQGRGGARSGTTKSHAHMTKGFRRFSSSHATQPSGFSKEDMQALRHMMAHLESSSTTTSSAFAHSGSVHEENDW